MKYFQPEILFHPIYHRNERNLKICTQTSNNHIPTRTNNTYQPIATINGIYRILTIDKDKTNKRTEQFPQNQGNVKTLTTHNIGTIFPITNQHLMIHHQATHIIKSSTYLYPSSSSSTASNVIDIKDTPRINVRKRTQHQLYYSTHYRSFNFPSPSNIHATTNKINDSEYRNNNSLISHHFKHNITNNPSPPYPSRVYIIKPTKHNTTTLKNNKNLSMPKINNNRQSQQITYLTKPILKSTKEFICSQIIRTNSNP